VYDTGRVFSYLEEGKKEMQEESDEEEDDEMGALGDRIWADELRCPFNIREAHSPVYKVHSDYCKIGDIVVYRAVDVPGKVFLPGHRFMVGEIVSRCPVNPSTASIVHVWGNNEESFNRSYFSGWLIPKPNDEGERYYGRRRHKAHPPYHDVVYNECFMTWNCDWHWNSKNVLPAIALRRVDHFLGPDGESD
jgi:hypothetical protein